MTIKPCPHCGEYHKFGYSRDSWYKYYLYHFNSLCPYQIEIFHKTEEACILEWHKYIEGEPLC